ncbi:glycosyltransferase family 2 protein [Lacihabitans sp. LS3-19]|uniref:glycosyltransferase family 2 protein n=1 Tax=Lacihabitans sp. LS3-19 TaxID=2487335 RepID=UPI0020CEC287|nr:glycosyltransferase family 2 protein [Lacihabitans sp. LS3-19]MCP9768227.1 glycosyltransferase family 2 protein [Lacihabitans sp. LS3-19]
MPKVTVILPNYNHQDYIEQRIESILNQDFKDFELIILDDASIDQSTQNIRKFLDDSRIKEFVINDQNSGSTFVQWEKGLQMAKGEYIWIAESDDMADRRFLTQLIEILDKNQKVGLAFCPSIWIDKDGKKILEPDHEEDADFWQGNNLIQNEFLAGNLIYNASSAVFRKSLINKINFSQIGQFKYTGDWLFWVQLLSNTQVKRIEKRLNYFRRHENNVSFKSDREGLQFVEGIKIALYIFKHYPISWSKKRKTMLFWTKKLFTSDIVDKSAVLKKMPFEVKLYFNFFKLFGK